jgi:Ca2+-binding EF-hand superfamily protein
MELQRPLRGRKFINQARSHTMSSSISSVGGYASTMMGMSRPQRPDSSKLAEDLFSQIDTTGKGYIEKADLESAFQQVTSTSSSSSADELFSSLDSDGDGKITQDEMSSSLKSLMDSLDSQFQSMRMSEAMSGTGRMPPPPPPENDSGFTKEELQSQLDEVGSSDSKRASLISNVIENFDTADADGDGRVTFKEAMALEQASSSSSSTSSSTSASTSTTEAQLMQQIMKLAQAYGLFAQRDEASGVSAVA